MAVVTKQKQTGRRTLSVCGGAHVVHDGFTDAVYVLLPIWAQAFGFSLTQVGFLKASLTVALAVFQIPAGFLSERIGAKTVLAVGTILAGIGYIVAGAAGGFTGLRKLTYAPSAFERHITRAI